MSNRMRGLLGTIHSNLIYWSFLLAGIGVGIKWGHPSLTPIVGGSPQSAAAAEQAYRFVTKLAVGCLLLYGGRAAFFGGASEISDAE